MDILEGMQVITSVPFAANLNLSLGISFLEGRDLVLTLIYDCSVACGSAHSLVVVDRTSVADRLDQVLFSLSNTYSIISLLHAINLKRVI